MKKQVTETTLEKILIKTASKNNQPINGSIELLPLCNMNCNMCYIRLSKMEMQKQGRLRTADEWIEISKQMQKAGTRFLLLTGGEPLLFPDFKKLYTALMEMGIILTVNTNGTLIDNEWADFFSVNRPRRINITLYGTNEKTYRDLCHYPQGYEKTLNGIRLLKERNLDVKINVSLTANNYKELDDFFVIGDKFNVPVHVDTYMVPCTRERNVVFAEHSRLTPSEVAAANIKLLKKETPTEFYQQYIRELISAVESPVFPYKREMACLAGNSSFTINWQGEMRPCVTLSEPSVSVFNTGFENAWQKVVTQTRDLKISEKCSNCFLRPLCKTCVASAFWETGDYEGIPEYNCQCAEAFFQMLYKEFCKY